MKIQIEINTHNQAFEDEQELNRILKEIIKKIASGIKEGSLSDINGNKVGNFSINN